MSLCVKADWSNDKPLSSQPGNSKRISADLDPRAHLYRPSISHLFSQYKSMTCYLVERGNVMLLFIVDTQIFFGGCFIRNCGSAFSRCRWLPRRVSHPAGWNGEVPLAGVNVSSPKRICPFITRKSTRTNRKSELSFLAISSIFSQQAGFVNASGATAW